MLRGGVLPCHVVVCYHAALDDATWWCVTMLRGGVSPCCSGRCHVVVCYHAALDVVVVHATLDEDSLFLTSCIFS